MLKLYSSHQRLLDAFFDLLYDTPAGQLDDYRAGYFDKILSILFRKRSQELSNYINTGGSRGQESLMEAMMKHLYSHSVMQICQRLLLPPRPTPKQEEGETSQEEGGGGGEPTEDGEGGEDILPGEEDDEDMNGIGIQCDWSKNEKAIDMLLQRLINPEILLATDEQISPVSAVDTRQSIDEQRLSLSLNASEVLITVIQNSMLSSETMLTLTSVKILDRLSEAATQLREGESFSPHESLLTSAMNVIESLILQLGGYGAVGTMSILEQADGEEPQNDVLIADLSTLLEVLPKMLKGFYDLLLHPSTKKWTSPVQFSKEEPVQLLGTSRLRIVRVLESLVLLGDPDVDSKLVESDCLLVCLDLFWEFQWCSMLHQSVANLLVHVFEGQNLRYEIQEYFLVKCTLLGRLMDSFVEQTDPRVHHLVMDLNKVASTEGKFPGSSDEALPVSEDDIEAAMEKQDEEKEQNKESDVVENVDMISTEAVDQESRDVSTVGAAAGPAQSFRFGYMGHVIIICQALVQACAGQNWEAEQGDEMAASQHQSEAGGSDAPSFNGAASAAGSTEGDEPTVEPMFEPLLIAQLVDNHELTEKWQEFVISSLASEIAVQSTPLGGLAAQPSDPLQSHRPDLGRRPGLADDGDIGDDAMAPPPPRGMLSDDGGDDSDLGDVAALMAQGLSGLSMGRGAGGPDDGSQDSDGGYSGSVDSGDSQRSYNSGETNNSGGYLFDDPLGQAGGSLGIQLGELTKYTASEAATPKDNDEGNESSDESSSDEEPPRKEDEDEGPQVIDLFAGNFDQNPAGSEEGSPVQASDAAAFDFANFDNAFEEGSGAPESFGEFSSAGPAADSPPVTSDPIENKNDVEDLFGGGASASSLLDELEDLPPPAELLSDDPVKGENDESQTPAAHSAKETDVPGQSAPGENSPKEGVLVSS